MVTGDLVARRRDGADAGAHLPDVDLGVAVEREDLPDAVQAALRRSRRAHRRAGPPRPAGTRAARRWSAGRRPARAAGPRRGPPVVCTSCPHACAMPRLVDAHGSPLVSSDGQRVEVGAQRDPLAPGHRGPGPMSQSRPVPGSRCGCEPRRAQPVGDQRGRPHLRAAELGVRVDVPTDCDELVAQAVVQRSQLRGDGLRGSGAQRAQRGDGVWSGTGSTLSTGLQQVVTAGRAPAVHGLLHGLRVRPRGDEHRVRGCRRPRRRACPMTVTVRPSPATTNDPSASIRCTRRRVAERPAVQQVGERGEVADVVPAKSPGTTATPPAAATGSAIAWSIAIFVSPGQTRVQHGWPARGRPRRRRSRPGRRRARAAGRRGGRAARVPSR